MFKFGDLLVKICNSLNVVISDNLRLSLITYHTTTGRSKTCKFSPRPRNTLSTTPIINRILLLV